MNPQTDGLATPTEVATALSRLTSADHVRLMRIAQLRSAGLIALEWKDLVNEAISRALAGSRRWPRSVPIVAFLAQTVRSIANEEWRRIRQANVTLESDMRAATEDEESPSIGELAQNAVHPERDVLARQTLAEIEDHFHGDSEILAILNGLAAGFTPEEVQSEARMTKIQYASAQKRLRRTLSRIFS